MEVVPCRSHQGELPVRPIPFVYFVVYVSVSVKTVIPLIRYPSFPTFFFSTSGVFCQNMIDCCAKVALLCLALTH